jgi:ABC-type Fe3+/spermidine/putrescine transport system ATPase subunit
VIVAFLEIESIDKTYEDAPLLRGVSLSVARGEVVSLLGPSGSGKTTLLRIIAGLEPNEGGSVFLEGRDLSTVPTHQRGVVLMFQEYALFPHRTVAQNVAFGLRMMGRDQEVIETKVAEMLGLMGLEGFAERSVVDLSGGERQRVALARSLAPEPRLLLLDEPLGSLDRTLRQRLLEELAVILRRVGVTTITVTHDQEEAFALADRVALLHGGQIVQVGPPTKIYRAPANAWVAEFLGLENLFDAEVTGEHQVETALGPLELPEEIALPEVGAPGSLLVMPWGVHLVDGETSAGDQAPNAVRGEVVHRTFHGRVFVIWIARDDVRLRMTFEVGRPVPEIGEEVEVRLGPDGLQWLDSRTGRAEPVVRGGEKAGIGTGATGDLGG